MFKAREQIEADERSTLAPYACKSAESLGRTHRETPHPYRTAFQRDRARIIHSAAFRRLDGKTQVFLNGTGDHYRTRLTHTIEVASIARTIARALSLNEDLAEAIALAHDLGHPPFGHSGEAALDGLMRGHGAFDHNVQSLRVVTLLEAKYPRHPGLNLSHEVIEGLQKHNTAYTAPDGAAYHSPSLEAQVADLADEITYSSHDLDDGLDAGLLDPVALEALPLWEEARMLAEREFRRLDPTQRRGYIIRCIVNHEVEDLVIHSARAIDVAKLRSIADVRRQKRRLIQFSECTRRGNAALRKFLFAHLYLNPAVAGANQRGCALIASLFKRYLETPSLIGRKAARRIKKEGLHRTVADYLSGMTDRYCIEQHRALCG
ncbi:MAG: deoxyguanosinetriphosphate triphosphohydrolase [Terrimicrobiaceae bacterium]|nr:deoxyguanosinetriphosphate triphosphohydrolase [Terrimicrobiaceae bacterium]